MTVVFGPDTFTRADEAPSIASPWNQRAGTVQLLSNMLALRAAGSIAEVLTAGHAAVLDAKVTATHVDAAIDGGPILRLQAGALTYYEIDAYTGNIEIYRYVAGAISAAIGNTAITLAAGSVVTFEATGAGATVTFTATYNGGAVCVGATDTNAARIVAAGQTGIKCYTVSDDWDNYQAEDLAVSTTVGEMLAAQQQQPRWPFPRRARAVAYAA